MKLLFRHSSQRASSFEVFIISIGKNKIILILLLEFRLIHYLASPGRRNCASRSVLSFQVLVMCITTDNQVWIFTRRIEYRLKNS